MSKAASMTTMIRHARASDVTSIVTFITETMQQHEYSRINHLDFAQDKVYHLLKSRVGTSDFFCVVVTDNDKIVGGIGAGIQQPFFSSSRVAVDYMLYVEPKYRMFSVVRTLLTTYVSWAKSRNVAAIELSTITQYRPERFARLAAKFGFQLSGKIYTRRMMK